MATVNEKVQNTMDNINDGLKIATMIGNSVLVGGLYGVLLLSTPWKIPFKIAAGISSWAISGVLSSKTSEYIDNFMNDIHVNVVKPQKNIENNLNNIVDIGK